MFSSWVAYLVSSSLTCIFRVLSGAGEVPRIEKLGGNVDDPYSTLSYTHVLAFVFLETSTQDLITRTCEFKSVAMTSIPNNCITAHSWKLAILFL